MSTAITLRKNMRASFYIGVAVSLAIIMLGWWSSSGEQLSSAADRLVAIGRLFGLLAAWSVVLQIILMSRVPFIERFFDLQDIGQLHKYNGYTLLATISGHVVFLVLGYALPSHANWFDQFVTFNTSYNDVFLATIGTIIFFVASALSLHAIRSRMNYELWFASHLTIYGAIAATFLHQISTGGDFIHNYWFTAFWYALYILAFVVWMRYRLLTPWLLMMKYDFRVVEVQPVTHTTYSVVLRGKNIEQFVFQPGQYATWRILTRNLWYEAHPFSISSTQGSGMLRFTVKASPQLTRRIANVPVGTRVLVDGPRGGFTAERADANRRAVLIAGGIGIAPYLSMIDALLKEKKEVTVLYSARQNADIAFRDELQALQMRGVIIRLFLDEHGQSITAETLKTIGYDSSTVYICGPDGMSRGIAGLLRSLGVSEQNIITERFSF